MILYFFDGVKDAAEGDPHEASCTENLLLFIPQYKGNPSTSQRHFWIVVVALDLPPDCTDEGRSLFP